MRITCTWCLKDTKGKIERYANRNFCKGTDWLTQYQRFIDSHARLDLRLEEVAPATAPSYGPWIEIPLDE
jgi:hypothetical protein